MQVIDNIRESTVSLPAKVIDDTQIKSISSALALKILKELAKKPSYPMRLSKKLKVHEQKIYYHIRKMEKSGIIEVIRKEEVHGTSANVYAPVSPSLVITLVRMKSGPVIQRMSDDSKKFLEPLIKSGLFDGTIVIGSPDPHGPFMSRSRDGYYGVDLGLFLGTFLNNVSELHVRLDTEVRSEDLQKNLLLLGGPAVNMITAKINSKLPVYFDQKNNWCIHSSISKKIYYEESCGLICKLKNPFNKKKQMIILAGKRHAGSRAITIAFLKYYSEIIKGNNYDKSPCKIVQGLDKDSDGIVDDVRFLE